MDLAQVFTGFWQNHSIPGTWGWTLTLSTTSANKLLIFLGIYLGFVGGYFWNILAFAFHQLLARRQSGNGIRHQIQLILRNSSSLTAAKQLASLAWHWREIETGSQLIVPILLSIIPLTIGVGFIVAGIEITSISAGDAAANQVKIIPENCGNTFWNATTQAEDVFYATWLTENGRDAKTYVQSCYGNSSAQQDPSACSSYPVRQIPYTSSDSQPCPFNDTMCILGPNTAFMLDTNLLDSQGIIGINAPVPNRISVRKVITCSVLDSSDYSNHTTLNGSEYHHLYYGEFPPSAYTWQYSDSAATDGFGYQVLYICYIYFLASHADMSCSPVIHYPNRSNSWFPIPELLLTDADESIYIMSANSLNYLDVVDDPMYSAHILDQFTGYYRPDNFYQVLGCAEQYQICGSGMVTNCTQLDSRWHVFQQLPEMDLNPAQLAIAEQFLNISTEANIFTSVFGIGSSALLARDQVFSDILSGSLPSNQWQLEAENIFAMSLARMQSSIIEYTSKSSAVSQGESITPPTSDQQQYLCNNQLMQNVGAYQSFYAAALVIVLAVGLFIAILGMTIDSIIGAWLSLFLTQQFRTEQWKTDNMFQQQRLAFSGRGHGTWAGDLRGIPTTQLGDRLAVPHQDAAGTLVY
jgi:hypothetical protein